jgi:hypothetical protein
VFQIDNVRFTGFDADADSTPAPVTVPFKLTEMGLGSYSDTINPASYQCVEDYGAWLYNAGVVPFTNLGTCNNVANANPVKRLPQLGGDAAQMHTMTHRWWGSLSVHWRNAYRVTLTVRVTSHPTPSLRVFQSVA